MRIATFNVENMFERVKAMNLSNWAEGESILEDFKNLNDLIQEDVYTPSIKTNILKIMKRHKGLLTQDESKYIRLRKIRGKFIAKPKNKPPEIAANGRSDWIGWFELETESVKETATENTARIISLIDADILCVVETENRTTLKRFNEDVLPNVEGTPYRHVMVIDGNDSRGIDVGIMTKDFYEIIGIHSHVDDTDNTGIIFSRDCAEYVVQTQNNNELLVIINHFKSKGYGKAGESDAKRLRQAKQVRKIYNQRLEEGYEYIAIVGDLNDTPDSSPLKPLIESALVDVMAHPKFTSDGRPGTHGNGTASAKLDYILMSPKLAQKVIQAGVERRGVWGGKNGTLFPHLPSMKTSKDSASDHAALWVDFDI